MPWRCAPSNSRPTAKVGDRPTATRAQRDDTCRAAGYLADQAAEAGLRVAGASEQTICGIIVEQQIKGRELERAIPPDASAVQVKALEVLKSYGQNRAVGVRIVENQR